MMLFNAMMRGGNPPAVGGSGNGVLTSTGNGTNANYAPLAFIDFIGLSNGDTWATAGGDFANGGNAADPLNRVDMTVGLPVGGGSYFQEMISIAGDWFTHIGSNLPAGVKTVTIFQHWKLSHTGGTVSQNTQMKGPRAVTTAEDYGSNPRVSVSHYFGTNNALGYGEPTATYHPDWNGNADTGVTRDSDTPADAADGNWHSTFDSYGLNTIDGTANGAFKSWMDGIMYYNTNLDVTDNPSTDEWASVIYVPGFTNGFSDSNSWDFHSARHVIFNGLAWVAFGNASTFAACTDLIVVEPTAWSDTEISFATHGTIPAEYDWVYRSTTAGVINSSGFTTWSIS